MAIPTGLDAVAPAIIGAAATVFTLIASKLLDRGAEERRLAEEGRRAQDHDIREENKELRRMTMELQATLEEIRGRHLIAILRIRELKHTLVLAGHDVPPEDADVETDLLLDPE